MARRTPAQQRSPEALSPSVRASSVKASSVKASARPRPSAKPVPTEAPAFVPVAANGTLFSVTRMRGAGWDVAKAVEQQAEWTEHAQFMNALEAQGFIIAGGPLEDTPYILLAVRAETPQQVRVRLAGDPWEASRLIETTSIRPWRLSLGAGRL